MSYPHASDISFNEAVFRLAAIHKKTVTFSYSKGDGKVIEHRRLEPTGVAHTKSDGEVYFTGFDPDRGAGRHYRLDRILGEVTLS
jgi:predicted DNA-binding transcriptional regulator YafY